MAYRTITVEVKVRITMKVDEGTEVSEVLNECDYNFSDTTGHADIEDTEIIDHDVTDSR